MILISAGEKDCIKCGDKKPLLEYHVNRQSKDGRRRVCKKCAQTENANYRIKNTSKCKAAAKKWANKNRIKARASVARYKLRHPERVKESNKKSKMKNKDKIKFVYSKWRASNLHKKAAQSSKRRAAKLKATPRWVDLELVQDIFAEAKYNGLQVDHIIPLQSDYVCGLHWEGNLQLLTKTENLSKGNLTWPKMWGEGVSSL